VDVCWRHREVSAEIETPLCAAEYDYWLLCLSHTGESRPPEHSAEGDTSIFPMAEPTPITIYAADRWEHVCPQVRTLGPLEASQMRPIRASHWNHGELCVDVERVDEAALVLIQRDFPRHPACIEIVARAQQQGKPVLYELDDLLTDLPTDHPDAPYYREARAAILCTLTEADAVIGGTEDLCAYLRQWNANVYCLPTYLNDRLWPSMGRRQFANDRPLRVGYMGGDSHTPDLASISAALEAVWERMGPRVEFVFWGIEPPRNLRGRERVSHIRPDLLSYAEFAAYFAKQNADIFIAPLSDNSFNRCKSSLKFLEYSWLGIPGIYSRVVTYERIVENGVNGLLADSSEEWEAALVRLIGDAALRAELGAAAHATVEANWRLTRHAHEWRETFEKVLHRPGAAARDSRRLARQLAAWCGQSDGMLSKAQERARSSEATVDSLREALAARGQQLKEHKTLVEALELELTALQREIGDLQLSVHHLREHKRQLEIRYDNDTQKLRRDLSRLQARYERERHDLELTVQEARERAEELDARADASERFRTDIEGSNAWRVMTVLWQARLRIAPAGSRREWLLRRVLAGRARLKRGVRRLFARRRPESPVGGVLPALPHGGNDLLLAPVFVQSAVCPVPAVTVLLVRGKGGSNVEAATLQAWLAGQTCGDLAVGVVWDTATAQMHRLGTPDVTFPVPDWTTLREMLGTPYLCLASSDLLDQVAIYLEAHLIALETEGLLLSVYLNGSTQHVLERLAEGCLPGGTLVPLLRQVVRTQYLRSDLSLDVDAWLADQRHPVAKVGRVILHTTNHADERLPMHQLKVGAKLRLEGTSLFAMRERVSDWSPVPQQLRVLSAVLPALHVRPDPRPTVIVLHPFLAVGGAERVCYDVMRILQNDVRFVVVTLEPWNTALGTTADKFRGLTPYVYTAPDYLLSGSLNYSLLEYLIARFDPHALYIANGANFIYDSIVALRRQYPNLHIANEVYDHQAGWINRYTPEIAMAIDAHLGCNRRICQAYIEHQVPLERVHLIENGLDPVQWNPELYDAEARAGIRKTLGIPNGKRIVTFAGRLHQQKRPLDFVELARQFEYDSAMVFVMLGDGPLSEAVDNELARLDLSNLRRLRFHSRMDEVYAISDVLVLPSEYEGMPMVIAEAQAMGVPVVATDVGNNREILEVTGGGVVVGSIGEVSSLKSAVIAMLANPPDSGRMREAFFSRFHIRDVAARRLRAILPGSSAYA
jgi:glycosyltransferase involved in cell wall biosynthesis